jgi:hypothetical protein
MPDTITIGENTFAVDVVTLPDGTPAISVVRDKMGWGADGIYHDVSAADPLPVRDPGTYGYAAGTAAGTVDVPALARLKRVAVLAGATVAATITIGGGNTITVPAGTAFDEQIPGAAIGADVVIGGTVQAFYVSWTV